MHACIHTYIVLYHSKACGDTCFSRCSSLLLSCNCVLMILWTAYCRSCGGKGCNGYYHLSCLEPPLLNAPLGVWHCHTCVRKKIEFGVHSVSEGVESVWDIKEASFSNLDGTVKIYHYLNYSYGWFLWKLRNEMILYKDKKC